MELGGRISSPPRGNWPCLIWRGRLLLKRRSMVALLLVRPLELVSAEGRRVDEEVAGGCGGEPASGEAARWPAGNLSTGRVNTHPRCVFRWALYTLIDHRADRVR